MRAKRKVKEQRRGLLCSLIAPLPNRKWDQGVKWGEGGAMTGRRSIEQVKRGRRESTEKGQWEQGVQRKQRGSEKEANWDHRGNK